MTRCVHSRTRAWLPENGKQRSSHGKSPAHLTKRRHPENVHELHHPRPAPFPPRRPGPRPAGTPANAPTPALPPPRQANPGHFTRDEETRIITEVRKRLASLPNYAVFDYLYFGIQGRNLILQGYASRPVLKSDAAGACKGIEGVERVVNQIVVLPFSPNDDRIRIEVYRRVYGFPSLRKYSGSSVGFGDFGSIARAAGGITEDPPLGFHAIHIVVNGGHVTLYGVVDSKQDAEAANIQANTAPGAFSVEDKLDYPNQKPNEK